MIFLVERLTKKIINGGGEAALCRGNEQKQLLYKICPDKNASEIF